MALENRLMPALTAVLLCLTSSLHAQSAEKDLPLVFSLGDEEPAYDEETMSHYASLPQACDNNTQEAYHKLSEMLSKMEEFARIKKINLDGIKAWMHFFWREDGRLEHIGFYFKPGSRQIDEEVFADFLRDFTQHYRMAISTEQKFAHYTSCSFPAGRLHQRPSAANGG
jgi:hypothetical protein